MKSITISEKPVVHLSDPDWIGTVWNLKSVAETRRKIFNDLKNENREKRNDALVTSTWATYHNNKRLADRLGTSRKLVEQLNGAICNMENELSKLTDEKDQVEKLVEKVGRFLEILSKVLYLRDHRRDLDLVDDVLNRELHTEVEMLEATKKYLQNKALAAWDEMCRLRDLISKLRIDVEEKTDGLDRDVDALDTNKSRVETTLKPRVLRTVKCAVTPEMWLQKAWTLILSADNEAETALKLRESLEAARAKTGQDFMAQFECVNFEFRKTIFDTDTQRGELAYQRKRALATISINDEELERLRNRHLESANSLKCAETRVEIRNQRPCAEQTRDEVQLGLFEEITTLRDILNEMDQCITTSMRMGNQIEDLIVRLDRQLYKKELALRFEREALQVHMTLLDKYPVSQVDKNIKEYGVDTQLPPETVEEVQPL